MNKNPQTNADAAPAQVAQHTPGPWFLRAGFSDWNMPKQHEIYRCSDPTSDRDCIAVVPSITPNPIGAKKESVEYANRQSANARLIAAAPELLQALEHCERALSGSLTASKPEALRHARAAITKAKGNL